MANGRKTNCWVLPASQPRFARGHHNTSHGDSSLFRSKWRQQFCVVVLAQCGVLGSPHLLVERGAGGFGFSVDTRFADLLIGVTGPDYILDISGVTRPVPASVGNLAGPSLVTNGRPWLAVLWRCCNVYSRVYIMRDESAYNGDCPSCGRTVRFRVAPDGTTCRFFEAH